MTLNTKKIKELENALDSLNIKVTSVNEKIKSHNRSHSNSKDPDLKNKKMVSINNEIEKKNYAPINNDEMLEKILRLEKKNKNMETYLSLIILFLIILMVFSIDSNILTKMS